MATKAMKTTKTTKTKESKGTKAKDKAKDARETRNDVSDGPLMDGMAAAVKKMVARAKERGYVTYDELNSVLPPDQVSSEQIEDTMAMLNEMGINIIESEETEDAAAGSPPAAEAPAEAEGEGEFDADGEPRVAGNIDDDELGRTDDPVRMYLREMGSVELLSREGEIAIAKRIEAGREAMIAGLCESPLTFQAVIIWRDELNEGKVFLRDIIDLEATYAGPDAKAAPAAPEAAAVNGGNPGFGGSPPQAMAPPSAPAGATPFKAPAARAGDGEDAIEEAAIGEPEMDEDDLENSMSLAAIEAELKPKVLETFDTIADAFKRLRRLQEQDIHSKLHSTGSLSPAQERKY